VARYTRYSWLRDYRGFLEFFFAQVFTQPHSTKPIEDCIEWGLQTTPETLVAIELAHVLDAPELLDGSGHAPHVRSPVRVNLLLRRFLANR